MKTYKKIEERMDETAELYSYYSVVSHALSHALLHDYCQSMAKLQGIEDTEVAKRVTDAMKSILKKDGWGLYPKTGENGKQIPALGMLVLSGFLVKNFPVPVLKMPNEVASEEKGKKKPRKRYI